MTTLGVQVSTWCLAFYRTFAARPGRPWVTKREPPHQGDTRPGEMSSPREPRYTEPGTLRATKMSRARPPRPSQVHWGEKGEHQTSLASTVGPRPLPPALPALAGSPVVQYLAFNSASTARRSMVLKRVFMARFDSHYRNFPH